MTLLVAASCATGDLDIAPDWYRRPPTRLGALQFLAEGTGSSEDEARADAVLSILTQMGRGLGYDLVPLYMREFSTAGTVAALGAYTEGSYSVESDDGWHYYMLAVAPSGTYYANRTEEYNAMLGREDAVRAFIAEAEESYRSNHDTEALLHMLEALDASLDGPVADEGLQPQVLLARAVDYLGVIRIDAWDGEDGIALRVWRERGLFHPDVADGTVELVYTRLASDGVAVKDSLVLRTDGYGHLSYVPTDPYALRYGELSFRPYIPEGLLSSIASKSDSGFLAPLMRQWRASETKLLIPSVRPADADGTVIAFAAYRADGSLIEESSAFNAFHSYLDNAGAGYYRIVRSAGEEPEEILADLAEEYGSDARSIIVRAGLVGTSAVLDGYVARADAQIIHDGDTQDASAVAEGPDAETAEENALIKASCIAAGMLLKRI